MTNLIRCHVQKEEIFTWTVMRRDWPCHDGEEGLEFFPEDIIARLERAEEELQKAATQLELYMIKHDTKAVPTERRGE